MTESKATSHIKSYLIAFFASLAILATSLLAIFQIIIPLSLSSYVFILVCGLLISPSIVIWLYIMYRTLVPITGDMPLKSFKQWFLLWPFIVGFITFWALLTFLFETFTPTLPSDYRKAYLPILIIATITVIVSITRLRYPVARFLNKVFGTKPTKCVRYLYSMVSQRIVKWQSSLLRIILGDEQ